MAGERERAIREEGKRFAEVYAWLEEHMPTPFFNEVPEEEVTLIVHALMDLHLQDFLSHLRMKHAAIVLCLDGPDADVRVLKLYRSWGVKNYMTYVSDASLPIEGVEDRLRVSLIYFTEAVETHTLPIPAETVHELRKRLPQYNEEEFNRLIENINTRFLGSVTIDRLEQAMDMFFRAKTRDHCQYEVRRNENWEAEGISSIHITLAWRNTPKYDGLYRLAQMVHRHGLIMRRVHATYVDPYTKHSILIMAIALHGADGRPAWEVADISDFLRELCTLKYFGGFPDIEETFVNSGLVSGNLGNLLKSMAYFIHQVLLHVDPYLYTLDSTVEALCRHPELTALLTEAFEWKFRKNDREKCQEVCSKLLGLVEKLDTGYEVNDRRRKHVLKQGINFIQHTLRTNFYRKNKSAYSFRLDPAYLDNAPFDREELFPELPYAVFFIKGMHYIGFHVRFRDLSRGGLRTVFPERHEDMLVELGHVFTECYNLAYTQQKKNKDIPEGGAKGVIFLKPYERLHLESDILRKELKAADVDAEEIKQRITDFLREQREEYIQQTQRSYVDSLLIIVNCDPDGTLRAKDIVNYLQHPEYIYLGPDERMGNEMITWIAQHAKHFDYKPGLAFISSKPSIGINHKEFGVTSKGVNVYMHKVLEYLGIDPTKDAFRIKISGGPDGDVAGNQILNLYTLYPDTAKLVALVDISGTIYDPEGLDLGEMVELFHAERPISFYPPEKLHEGGYLLDRRTKRDESAFSQTTLCWRKRDGKVVQDWLSGSEMNHLFHMNVHQAEAEVFVPAGGRPRTLHEGNVFDFFDAEGNPTSRAIVEGANLYLTPGARLELQKRGVLIIKDSSANKGGVICSSFEVLCGLVLSGEEMLENKPQLTEEILETLCNRAADEADLLLRVHRETGTHLTEISDWISTKINDYFDQLVAYPPLIDEEHCLLAYCLPFLRENYEDRILRDIPDSHKRAIIACHIASRLVYSRGVEWHPTIADILPLIRQDPDIC